MFLRIASALVFAFALAAADADTNDASASRVVVIGTTPVEGSEMDPDKIPAGSYAIDGTALDHDVSSNLPDTLLQRVPSVQINDVTGNPYQPDVQYRGFTASPVLGTPQGLAVYQDGVRTNEAFGDTVNWDLIPEFAIDGVEIVSKNAKLRAVRPHPESLRPALSYLRHVLRRGIDSVPQSVGSAHTGSRAAARSLRRRANEVVSSHWRQSRDCEIVKASGL